MHCGVVDHFRSERAPRWSRPTSAARSPSSGMSLGYPMCAARPAAHGRVAVDGAGCSAARGPGHRPARRCQGHVEDLHPRQPRRDASGPRQARRSTVVSAVAVSVAVNRLSPTDACGELPGGVGAPGRDRTGDISLTRRVLCPAELQGRVADASIATDVQFSRAAGPVSTTSVGGTSEPPSFRARHCSPDRYVYGPGPTSCSRSWHADESDLPFRDAVDARRPWAGSQLRAGPLFHSDRPARSCR